MFKNFTFPYLEKMAQRSNEDGGFEKVSNSSSHETSISPEVVDQVQKIIEGSSPMDENPIPRSCEIQI